LLLRWAQAQCLQAEARGQPLFCLQTRFYAFLSPWYSIARKVGVWSTGPQDFMFFGLGIVGLILWQTLNEPVIAIIFAISADLFFGLPTIVKIYKDPSSETPFVWATASLSGLFSLFALRNFGFSEAAYPVYLFIFDSTVLLLVLRLFSRRTKS